MAENLTPRFLSTHPEGEDKFSSGSQNRTAEAIMDYILSGASSKLIGIEGRWGVGKSNVINIIKKKFKKAYYVYIYDAWSHQEGLHRRSFLEDLIKALQEEKIIDKEKWENEVDEILAKTKITTQKTTPQLSVSVIIAFCATILVPVSTAIARVIDHTGWRIVVASAPIALALIAWIVAICRNKENINVQKFFYIFKTNEIETKKNEFVRERETSIPEFKRWMSALNDDLTCPLIIVFDNMDRLPSDKMKQLWSSIHTFFSEQAFDKIWIIVPFDSEQVSKAFSEGSNEPGDLKFGYIQKTFSVVFNVTAPVLTDWQGLFKDKFHQAFKTQEDEYFDIVKNVFDRHNDLITPRKIISFINDLVALKLIWVKEIPIAYLAIYVCKKHALLNDPVKQILSGQYLEKVPHPLSNDETMANNIAALVYNIDREDALQITLMREAEISIRETQRTNLEQLIKSPKFPAILEQILLEKKFDLEPFIFSLNFLESTNFKKVTTERIMKDGWQLAINQYMQTNISQLELTEAHKILIMQSNVYQLGDRFPRYLIKQFEMVREFKGNTYFDQLVEFDMFCITNGLPFDVNQYVGNRSLSSQEIIDYAGIAGELLNKFSIRFDVGVLEKDLQEYLIDEARVLPSVFHIHQFYPLLNFKRRVEDQVSDLSINHHNLAKVFIVYKELSSSRPLEKTLSISHIDSVLENAIPNSRAYYELLAMRVARISEVPTVQGVSESSLEQSGEELVHQVAERISDYGTLGNLLMNSLQFPKPLVVKTAKYMLLHPKPHFKLNILTILERFNQFLPLVTDEVQLIMNLSQTDHNAEATLNSDNISVLLPNSHLFKLCTEVQSPLTQHVLLMATNYIRTKTEQEWDVVFNMDNDPTFRLLHILLHNNIIDQLPNQAAESLNNLLQNFTNRSAPAHEFHNSWHLLYKKSNQPRFSAAIKNLRDYYINKVDITELQFQFLEPFLRIGGDLIEKASDVVRTIVNKVIARDEIAEIIFANSSFYADLTVRAGADRHDMIRHFRQKIEADAASLKMVSFCTQLDHAIVQDIEIISALYKSDDEHVANITDKMREVILSEKRLHFRITNELAGSDPHVGYQKRLELTYKYEGKNQESTFLENQWVHLP